MSGAPGEESEAQRLEREAKKKEEADEAARNQFPPPPPPMTQQNFLQYMQMLEERQRVTMEQQNKFFQELLQQNRVERPENQGVTLSDFQNTKPISFAYAPEPMDAEDWLMDTERKLNTVGCNDLEKVRYATHLLCGPAASWWDNIVAVYPADKVFTWDEFKRKFRESNVPESIVELKRREFESLEQKDKAILTYVREFSGLSRYAVEEVNTEDKKKKRFMRGLNPQFKVQLRMLRATEFQELVDAAITLEDDFKQLQDEKRKKAKFEPKAETKTSPIGSQVSDILLPHPSLPNSMCLGPRSSESPAHLISCEANRIPFVNQDLDLTSWADCLRAWPNPPEGWVAWYNTVSKTHYATWETIGIADALSLSLSPLEKNENILKTIGYFWSDALNCFMFGHGPMTPTLLDVAMITGLDIASPSPSAFKLPKVPFTLSSKTECTSWGAYLKRYMKTKGPVTEREHTAFLNFWLEHFIFCGPSLAPTKNYLSLAYELAKGTQLGLGKLFLGEVYRSLQLMSVKLFSQKTVKTGGPWWFIQLWAQLYFQNQIPDFPPLATCTFPDANGREIRCTSYGQALYGLPGSRLIPKEAAAWFKIFFQGLSNPLFFPYTESENFENPVSFRLDSFADDASTRHLFSIMIRPCFLPVGMSTSNRIIKPGYESYQPVVVARQLGLGQVPPHFFLHHLTASRAELPDILTGQRCYTFFDALAIPIPHNLCFTTTTDGFETWWTMWKTHAFRRALGPSLKQLDAEYDIPTHQEQDGPEPTQTDGSPFTLLPPAPVVLFCRSSPPLKQVIMQGQPISPKSASKSKASSGPVAPRASTQARKAVRKVAARKTLKRKAPQENLHTSTEENSSEDAQSRQRDTNPGNSERSTTQSQTDSPTSVSRQRSTPEPAATPAPTKTGSRVKRRCVKRARKVHGPLQRLKTLLSSSVKNLVENPEAVTGILEGIQSHLPVTLQVKLWPAVTLLAFRSRVQLARQRITLRHAQLPMRADIAEKCRRLNEKKAALDAKTDTSANSAELETLRKELENLEERVRMTKRLIQEKETLIARSREEAQGLTADLKTDLAEIRALSSQLVTGKDEDDEAEIAEVDRIRADALHALDEFLQRTSLCRCCKLVPCCTS
ncbi:hypothetical protein QYE76_017487 [Lolium multiflorum]|uniref:Aminotransferase-like plant mobile domain-containing protein n=1 Tax=Lolium multiflorum TaxID=4521 RepID=A0AAD8UUK6_LOLMU|nr:hypothetical protein QYE76_017487 [Lolium multiflorum]